MPLKIVRAPDVATLWDHCADTFLAGAPGPGPTGHRDWVWLSHRNLRDRLLDTAQERGHPGWLDPPVTFFGDLSNLFDLREQPVGLLTRRRILARQAANLGRDVLGQVTPQAGGIVRSHVLDSLLADLLPEGVEPEALREALDRLPGDDFTRARNEWIVSVYAAYLEELERLGRPDWRAVNAILADRIVDGALPATLRGAERLHIYGITSPRTRRRLLTALAEQQDIDVRLYLIESPEEDPFFAQLTDKVEHLAPGNPDGRDADGRDPDDPDTVRVQPAPDAAREMDWVARQVKELLIEDAAEPHDIAIVARSGRNDTRRAFRALEKVGVAASARIRTPLAEITALKALLLLFRGAARDWDYRTLRAVLDHPLLDTKVDLRGIDFIAVGRRVTGLDAWREKLEHARRLTQEGARETWGEGLFDDRLAKDIDAFDAFRAAMAPLSESRTEGKWIDLTLGLLREKRGVFFLRRRLCDAVADRWDLVRLDQRGVIQLERLLREWRDLDLSDAAVEPAAWYALLARLLEGQELALSTPRQKGVQILEAHDAGLVPFRHTFVVHANDGEFPLVRGASGVLSPEERAALQELGIPVDHRQETMRRERALWRAVTAQAGDVTISYRTTNPSGTPLLPSLMVPSHRVEDELPRQRRPADLPPVSPREADEQAAFALAQALGRHGNSEAPEHSPILAPAHPRLLRQAIVAAVAESHRGPGLARCPDPKDHPALRPNPWNGEIRDPDVLQRLAEEFRSDRLWSASQLESYARVPFQFFLERILRVAEHDEAEEETSALTFGGVAHEILEKFYAEHRGELPSALVGPAAARLEAIAREVFEAREARGEWLGLPALWETSRETVLDAVRGYVEWELVHLADKGEVPVMIEHEFGYDDEAPLLIEGVDLRGNPARLRLRGRIDRVDRTGSVDSPVFHVLDYKSSKTPSNTHFEDGTALQGALYLEVLVGQGHKVKHCRYRAIKRPGSPQNGGQISHGDDRHDTAIAIALSIPARVLAGRFEPVASHRGGWMNWDVPLEIRRTDAQLDDGHRFAINGDG